MHRSSRIPANAPRSIAILVAIALAFGAPRAIAGSYTMTCGTPTAAGTVTLRIIVGKNALCTVAIKIPAPPKPPVGGEDTLKAELIRKTIAAKCTDVTVERKIGSNQVVVSFPAREVEIEETGNTTGELDTYAMATLGGGGGSGWAATLGQVCTLTGHASGLSWNGVDAGSVTVGTTAYAVTVPTTPGESAAAVLAAALSALTSHGVAGVSMLPLGPQKSGLVFHLSASDSGLTWGCDDAGLLDEFVVLQDSLPLSADPSAGVPDFFVLPGMPGVSLHVDPSPLHTHSELTLYGYNTAQGAWLEQGFWSVGEAPAQIAIAPNPQTTHYQVQLSGDHPSITGLVKYLQVPLPQTPSTPLFVPGTSLGWADGSGLKFNPTLGQGGGIPAPIMLQPGLSLNNVPLCVGTGFWQYLPLQFIPQPDPARPWLYLGNDPSQALAEPLHLTIQLTGIFDSLGNPIAQLPIAIDLVQGATQRTFSANAQANADGSITVPVIDLGPILAQPFRIDVGVPPPFAPDAASHASATGAGPYGYMRLDAVSVQVSSQPQTSGVGDPAALASLVQFRAPTPNPCMSGTVLSFTTVRTGTVRLRIFDAGGRQVRTLADGVLPAGAHELAWDGRADDARRVGGGMYFARLDAGGAAQHRKIALLR